MTPRQIEDLKVGPEADAEIERQFFGHTVYKKPERDWFDVDEAPDNPNHAIRAARQFSAKTDEALKILAAAPGWRIWHADDGINVQLSVAKGKPRPTAHNPALETLHMEIVTGIGRDESLPLAICKAALMLTHAILDNFPFLPMPKKFKPILTLQGNFEYERDEEKTPDTKRD